MRKKRLSWEEKIELERASAHRAVDELIDLKLSILRNEKKGIHAGKMRYFSISGLTRFSTLELNLLSWFYDRLYGAYCRYDYLGKPDDFDWDSPKNTNFDVKYSKEYEKKTNQEAPYPLSMEDTRNFMATIFSGVSIGSPIRNFYSMLAHGLKALNSGEIHAIVCPEKKGYAGNSYTLNYLRWIAVLYVWIEWGKTGKKHQAQSQIADELQVTADQLISWEKSLLKKHDEAAKGRKHYRAISAFCHIKDLEKFKSSKYFQDLYPLYGTEIHQHHLEEYEMDLRRFTIMHPKDKLRFYLKEAMKKPGTLKVLWFDRGQFAEVILTPQ